MKGKRFEDIDGIKKNVTSTLNTIQKDSFKNFSSCGRTLEAACQLTRTVF
jgi:hypothetical protein